MSSTPTHPLGSPGVLLATAVSDLDDASTRLAALTADGALVEVPAVALIELAAVLHRAIDRATAVATVATGVLHTTDALAADGHATTKSWLQTTCRKSETEAKVLLATAGALREDYPSTTSAWLAGEVPGGAVREITRGIHLALRSLPFHERPTRRAEAETILLTIARTAPVTDVARAARYLRFVTDPDGASQAQLDAHDDQQLSLRPVGVGFALYGYLTAETGAALATVLTGIVEGWYHDGSLAPEDQPSGHPHLDEHHRKQRRPHLLALALGHLATTTLATRGGDRLLGSTNRARPAVTLTVDLDRLSTGLGGELHLPGHDQAVPLPGTSIRRILCDTDLHPVLTTTPTTPAHDTARVPADPSQDTTAGETATTAWRAGLIDRLRDQARTVLYLGRTQRTTPVRLRRALTVRDQHCAFPGCHVDTTRTQAHHILEWENDGETTIANTVLLCQRHHHLVHEGRWSITPTPDTDPHTTGCWTFTPPPRRQP
jgi:hypothetical protein